ncbi:MAG: HAMP domain-containing sensor histidine kinase [Solirubrobacteraceae bacterium]|nr:HAMP domain-containing sensor histidine kinase [Patulibacter sp.]
MKAPRLSGLSLRTRLVAAYALVFILSMAAVLMVSYLLLASYLRSTLPAESVDPILGRLAGKYVLALIGTALIATSLGWLAARRLLAPIHAITNAARLASGEALDERLQLDGPQDELRELGDTFDAMLDRFQESIETQRRFIANASHELRSPLTAIRTEVDVTLSDPDATVEELREMGERVLEGGDHLDELLASLMVLARSQRGLLAKQPTDLATVASIALEDARPAAAKARVGLDVRVGAAPVVGDPVLLRRVIANLLDNAVRYNERDGQVTLDVATDGTRATVRVTNTGILIPPDQIDRLRQPFERLGRHGNGSGLGLSIVQAVAEAHDGTVRLRARPEGGLDVTVALPAAAGVVVPTARREEASPTAAAGEPAPQAPDGAARDRR